MSFGSFFKSFAGVNNFFVLFNGIIIFSVIPSGAKNLFSPPEILRQAYTACTNRLARRRRVTTIPSKIFAKLLLKCNGLFFLVGL